MFPPEKLYRQRNLFRKAAFRPFVSHKTPSTALQVAYWVMWDGLLLSAYKKGWSGQNVDISGFGVSRLTAENPKALSLVIGDIVEDTDRVLCLHLTRSSHELIGTRVDVEVYEDDPTKGGTHKMDLHRHLFAMMWSMHTAYQHALQAQPARHLSDDVRDSLLARIRKIYPLMFNSNT